MNAHLVNCVGRHRSRSSQEGFTYLGLLLLLALMAGLSALTLEFSETVAQRSKEAELQAIGDEFSHAFERYYRTAAAGKPAWPSKLEDLLSDPRFPGVVRHLRRIYANPLNGKKQWGTIAAPGGGIMGVYPLAEGTPIRKPSRTLPRLVGVKPENGYAEWRFGYDPMMQALPQGVPPASVPSKK